VDYFKAAVFQARTREADPAIATLGGVASFGALLRTTSAAVEALRAAGVTGHAPVMLDVRNPLQHLALMLALGLLGIPSASVATSFVTQSAGPRPQLFLTDRTDVELAGLPCRAIRIDDRWLAVSPGAPIDYDRLLSLPGFPSVDSVVRYVFSSGTTGTPKCIAITHRVLEQRMISTTMGVAWWAGAQGAISMLGFSTIAGTLSPILNLSAGRLMCFGASGRDVLHLLNMFSVSLLTLSVGQLQALLAEMKNDPPPVSLRLLTVAGARLPVSLLREARAKLCTNVWVSYGSTEMGNMSSGTSSVLETDEGCAGYVWPWMEIETVDGNGRPLPRGQDGIIRVRSPEAASYAGPGGELIDMYTDGWFYTGDVGRVGPDGLLTITGRASDVINRGGVVVAPEYIEEAIRLRPGISDVAVFGVIGAGGIEEIWAAVVSSQRVDAASLIAALRPSLNERAPDRVIQVEAIPRGDTGKVQRSVLRERAAAMPGA
jgi:acyl-coenzyme A synthetase/AMP-(fatty) acid ligase